MITKRRHPRILCVIMVVLFMVSSFTVPVFASDNAMEGKCKPENMPYSFNIVSQTFEYGSDVIAVIINMGKNVDGKTISKDTFSVSTTNLKLDGTVFYQGSINVVDAYVNNNGDVDRNAPNGRYIVLKLETGFTVTAAKTMYYDRRNYLLTMNYEVKQNKPFEFTNKWVVDGTTAVYTKAGEINLVADEFAKLTEGTLNYRLFTPRDTSIAQPLVLFLHGAGESGTNNESQLRANLGAISWAERSFQIKHQSYVLAPQSNSGWSTTDLTNIYNVIKRLIDEGKVDKNRIYVTGMSMGGGGTYKMLLAYPDLFAAAIPICPAISLNSDQAALITKQPIWMVQAANDPAVNVVRTRANYEVLQTAGADIYYTEFPDVGIYSGHWVWVYVFNNFIDMGPEQRGPIMNWLFDQVKE